MKIYGEYVKVETRRGEDLVDITDLVSEIVGRSGVSDGMVTIYTMHTTTGIVVNEGEEGLTKDIVRFLSKLVPENGEYMHHHFFREDGRMAVNAWAHLRSILTGMHTSLPVSDRRIVIGMRQRVFLIDFDGPQARSIYVQVIGI
ncbi:MAG: secondary thiamine-phosphate synthase enzyme YjbQ [Nitrososphaerota archaeon]|nr:secondary thiamine-phosphate synthase enzyme YjbQ [Candidatus Bathyarchaeota archaeon]MDW8062319.1 secondary thiamine-phosphate synthase enzyme YjbQ [Nitrososphaerota archaeon]